MLLLAFLTTAAAPLKLGFIDPVSNSSLQVIEDALRDAAVAGFANLSVVSSTSPGVITGSTSMAGVNSIFSMRKDSDIIGFVTERSTTLLGPAVYSSMRSKPIVSYGASDMDLVDKSNTPLLLRTVPSSAPELDAMARTILELGWGRVACLVSESLFDTFEYFRVAANSLGIDIIVTSLAPDTQAINYEQWRLRKALESIVRSGARIVVSLTRTIDQMKIQSIAAACRLHDIEYQWLGLHQTYTPIMLGRAKLRPLHSYLYMRPIGTVIAAPEPEPETEPSQVEPAPEAPLNGTVVAAPEPEPEAAPQAQFQSRVEVRHEASAAYEDYAYDTAWLYAMAIANMTAMGVDPKDGAALLNTLRATEFDGRTGPFAFHGYTQDRLHRFELVNLQQDVTAQPEPEPELPSNSTGVACDCGRNITYPLVAVSVGAIGEIRLSEIEWPAGYRPDDGTASDARMSRLTVLTPKDQILVGRSLLLRVSLRDSFGNVPINQSLATLALAVVNGSQSLARVVGQAQDAAPEPEPEWAQETAEKDFELELLASGELYIEVRLSGRPGLPLLPLGEHSCTVLAPAPPDRTAWYAAAAALGAGVLLGGGFYLMHRRSRRAIEKSMLRLRSSGRPPALQLGPNERWHLFLSHTWGSGQDQAHALKEQTLRMLPSCKVFLDVHDLDDIDKLEQYIAATAVILLFISKDYFKSPNCLREVRAALDQKKPLLLVHEANVKRGGDTLEALMSECPEELRDAVFSGRPVLPYLRLPQLQLQTVVEICLGVVRVSGKMAKGSWLRGLESATGLDLDGDGAVGPEASVSGKGADAVEELDGYCETSILRARMCPASANKSVTIFASIHNPGAASLARTLQNGMPPGFIRVLSEGSDNSLPPEWTSTTTASGPARVSAIGSMRTLPFHAHGSTAKLSKAAEAATPQSAKKRLMSAASSLRLFGVGRGAKHDGAAATQKVMRSRQALTMLLFLNEETFVGDAGEALAALVRTVRAAGTPILMVHDVRTEFGTFFRTTPQDLILGGLFRDVALPLYPAGRHREACLATLHQWLGAKPERAPLLTIPTAKSRVAPSPAAAEVGAVE